MGVFDGDVTHIAARIPARGDRPAYTVDEFTWGDPAPIVAGFKAQGAIAVMVDEFHYVKYPRIDLSFGEEWEW